MYNFLRYGFVFATLTLFALSCRQNTLSLPSLEETFSKRDKMPFGTYVACSQLENIYPHNTIFLKRQNFKTTWHEMSDTGALYVCISKNLFLSVEDLESVLQYVSAGNTMFISSNNISNKLLDTLGCSAFSMSPSIILMPEALATTSVSFTRERYLDSSNYSYFYYPLINSFIKYDSANTQVLGVNERGGANFITLPYGRGRFFLHVEPNTFSNYFLLQRNNYHYLQNAFAYTKAIPEQIFWDDYYCNKNTEDESDSDGSLDFLLKYPPLKWAFWLTLLLFFIYIFFGGKRRQRIINVTVPNKNTTVAFTETVGRLYLQKHNNRNIADKIILHFFEHIRTQYYLNTNHINDIFITTLSRKSNVPMERVNRLFKMINIIQNNYDISDQQLLALNQQIENFTKTNI